MGDGVVKFYGRKTEREGVAFLAFWRRHYSLHDHKFRYGLPSVVYTDSNSDDIHLRFCACHDQWIEVGRFAVTTYDLNASKLEDIAKTFMESKP